MHLYNILNGHTIVTCTNRNDGHMEKLTRADTMGESTKKGGWVAIA